ncbi:hypothetical protein JCM6882_009290 [Rhodosporidiobolus microsporus]
MLDRLPIEIVQYILRLAFPLFYSPSAYKKRLRGLRALCLVSKAVKEVAKPMKAEILAVDYEDHVAALASRAQEEENRGETNPLCVLALEVRGARFRAPWQLEVHRWGGLADLTVSGGSLTWSALTGLTDVRLFLKPSTWPALRVLSVSDMYESEYRQRHDLPSLNFDLFPWRDRLSVLSIEQDALVGDPRHFIPLFSMLLVTISVAPDLGLFLDFSPTYCRLLFVPGHFNDVYFPSTVVATLTGLAVCLQAPPGGAFPTVLVLPEFLTARPKPEYVEPTRILLERCQQAGVTVLWDDGMEDEAQCWLIPQSFVDYKRQLSAAEEQPSSPASRFRPTLFARLASPSYSTVETRSEGGMKAIEETIEKLEKHHLQHIEVYGSDNDLRLTGRHETGHIGQFSSGVANRGSSIRIPKSVAVEGKGYFEDRRPASNIDPYQVCDIMVQTTLLSA